MPANRADGAQEMLRRLPQVERLAEAVAVEAPHPLKTAAARAIIEEARLTVLEGKPAPDFEELVSRADSRLRSDRRRRLTTIINATGVLLHTNLGRSPLGSGALEAIARIAPSYSNLEYDLERGERGSRYEHTTGLLKQLTGAESALVVNNNAGAVLLALSGLARDREVVISRGELIEIGGEFRLPEILQASGARLREVGTTNRTHPRDYRRAMGDDTALIMKVHPSNYRIVGFTKGVSSAELAALAHKHGVGFVHDLGSGLLRRRIGGVQVDWLADEPAVSEAVAEGADLVTFSGDKLLGGPQAGIIVGRSHAVNKLKAIPLLRALRVDKVTLAALEATLMAYVAGREAELPFWKMALQDPSSIEERARKVAELLPEVPAKLEITGGESAPGGGSAPGRGIPTALLEVAPRDRSPDEVARRLLDHDPPVVARIADDRVVVDLRGVPPEKDAEVVEALRACI